jgi:hypothetical protein
VPSKNTALANEKIMIQPETTDEPPKYRFELATNRVHEEFFMSRWNDFLSNAESQDAVYQTPEFFKFLLETSNEKNRPIIFSIIKNDGDQLVGIVPVRIRNETITFQFGSKRLASKNMRVIGLLGSVPLAPAEHDLIENLFSHLLNQFTDCQAICMAALPSSSTLWNSIQNSTMMSKKLCIHVVDGWRQCHTIPLPPSFELYLQQFHTKKRYNLNRQIRLLREHCGTLSLHRIQHASEVPRLTCAMNDLTTVEERTVFLSEEKCRALASQNLLLCYVLNCGQETAAVIFGTHSSKVFHIHNILYSFKLPQFSIGTSILHLAIEDMATFFNFSSIDLGYGVPGHTYQSSNIKKERGYVLACRRNFKNKVFFLIHEIHTRIVVFSKKIIKNSIVIEKLKKLVRRLIFSTAMSKK